MDEVNRYLFGDLEAVYLFYYWYARINGFWCKEEQSCEKF